MNKTLKSILAVSLMSSIVVLYQNCSQPQSFSALVDNASMKIDGERVTAGGGNIDFPSYATPITTNPPNSQNNTPPVVKAPVAPSICGCEFSMKAAIDQGYTTSFYFQDGVAHRPDGEGRMTLPGNMNQDFYIHKGSYGQAPQTMTYYRCDRGMLEIKNANHQVVFRGNQAAANCAEKECKVNVKPLLDNGYKTTYLYLNNKMYTPDSNGILTLPGNMGTGTTMYFWQGGDNISQAKNVIDYNCSRGILTTYLNGAGKQDNVTYYGPSY